MLKEHIEEDLRVYSMNLLRKCLKEILQVGDLTNHDRKLDRSYISIIIEINTLIGQLKKYANRN